jgi:hypothetical protein
MRIHNVEKNERSSKTVDTEKTGTCDISQNVTLMQLKLCRCSIVVVNVAHVVALYRTICTFIIKKTMKNVPNEYVN